MKTFTTVCAAALLLPTLRLVASTVQDTRCYEMRVYYAPEGKLDALHARFRDHTTKLFARHGMENIGYWVPLENKENQLIYVLAYPSREAREKSWKSFGADPEWKTAHKASEVDGKLVARADSYFMDAVDFSPLIKPEVAGEPRIFELREYTASKGNLPALDARFRNHTTHLFQKHGMQNLAYWHLAPGQKGAEDKLIYILAHKSKEAAGSSFNAFRVDPDWVKARTVSEKKAGGSLTDSVKSTFLQPTDYSPTK